MKTKDNMEICQKIVFNAIRMAGRSLDLTTKADFFKWEDMAESLIINWKNDDYDYQLMVEREFELVQFAQGCLIEHAHDVIVGG